MHGYLKPPNPQKDQRLNQVIYGACLLIVLRLISLIFFTTTTVEGPSMNYTLTPHQELWVNRYEKIDRGDLAVIDAHQMEAYPKSNTYIKRIIGLPGDTIESTKKGLLLNGQPFYENYLSNEVKAHFEEWTFEELTQQPLWNGPKALPIPEGYYFVLGDNRLNSEDSRHFGLVPKEAIKGVAHPLFWDKPLKTKERKH